MHNFWMCKFRKGLGGLLGKECLTASMSFETHMATYAFPSSLQYTKTFYDVYGTTTGQNITKSSGL